MIKCSIIFILLSFIQLVWAQQNELLCEEKTETATYQSAYLCYLDQCKSQSYFDISKDLDEKTEKFSSSSDFLDLKNNLDNIVNENSSRVQEFFKREVNDFYKDFPEHIESPINNLKQCSQFINKAIAEKTKQVVNYCREQLILAWQSQENLKNLSKYRERLPKLKREVITAIFGNDIQIHDLFKGIDVKHITHFPVLTLEQWKNADKEVFPKFHWTLDLLGTPQEIDLQQDKTLLRNQILSGKGCEKEMDPGTIWRSFKKVESYCKLLETYSEVSDHATYGGDINISAFSLKDETTFDSVWSHEFAHIIHIYLSADDSRPLMKKAKKKLDSISSCFERHFATLQGKDTYNGRFHETFADEVANVVVLNSRPVSCDFAKLNHTEYQHHLKNLSSSNDPEVLRQSKKYLDEIIRADDWDPHLSPLTRIALSSLTTNASSSSCKGYLENIGFSKKKLELKTCFKDKTSK